MLGTGVAAADHLDLALDLAGDLVAPAPQRVHVSLHLLPFGYDPIGDSQRLGPTC